MEENFSKEDDLMAKKTGGSDLESTTEKLQEDKQIWHSLAKNAPDILVIADSKGVIQYVNRTIKDRTPEQIRGENICNFMEPAYHKTAKNIIKQVFKGAKSGSYVYKATMNGNSIWYDTKVGPIKRDGEVIAVTLFIRDITHLREVDKEVVAQKKALERKNIALREILEQLELEKKQITDNVVANAENLLLPIIEKLRVKGASSKYVKLLEENVENLTSSFGRRMVDKKTRLTPKEIEISNMIRSGLASKEIANLMNLSIHTVEKHRLHIRRKLGVSDKKINLTTFLQTL